MHVFPDPFITLLQFIPFVLLLLALPRLIFNPLLDYLAERNRRIEGYASTAGALSIEVERRAREIELRTREVRAEVLQARTKVLKEAQDEQASIIAEARLEAEKRAEQFRLELDAECARQSIVLRADAQGLGDQIAATVLGRQVV